MANVAAIMTVVALKIANGEGGAGNESGQ